MPVVFADFVRSVPQPLTAALVRISPLIAVARHVLEVASWRQSWQAAWLMVASWWVLCLSAETVLRYLFPLLLLAVFLAAPRRRPTTILTTERSLQATVTDLQTIHSLLPTPPSLPRTLRTPLRIIAILYLPYLFLTYFVRLRTLLAVTGTVLLLARAPFVHVAVSVFLRSAWCRSALQLLISFLTAQPSPPIIYSQQPTTTCAVPVPELRFLFTIYENQRWWMGLDWTAALLPNERPSWCSAPPVCAPASPPSAYSLPSPSTVFLSDGQGKRVKRTAIWRWEEPEWKVLVRTDTGRISRVDRPIPDDASVTSGTGSNRLLKAAGKIREAGLIGTAPTVAGDDGAFDGGLIENEDDDIPTDADGWVYGDNTWEALGPRGGIGKYTRQRRWTRVAVVYESVEVVEDGPTGVQIMESIDATPSLDAVQPSRKEIVATGAMAKSIEEESPLRQRLRRALSKPAYPPAHP